MQYWVKCALTIGTNGGEKVGQMTTSGPEGDCTAATCNWWQRKERDRIVSVTPRAFHAAAPFPVEITGDISTSHDQFLVIHGGYKYEWDDQVVAVLNTVDFFDLDSLTWIKPTVEQEEAIPAMYFHTAASFRHLPGIVFYGGVEEIEIGTKADCGGTVWILTSAEKQNLRRLAWKKGSPGPARCHHTAVALDSKMVVLGGCATEELKQSCPTANNDIYVYDVNTDTWRKANPRGHKPPFMVDHSAVAMNGDCTLIAAGLISFLGRQLMHKQGCVPIQHFE